jgi:hypothetical protein
MKLDSDTNYIVSGLERSGTSMLMQILQAGGIPIMFDRSRKSDKNNPRGYYELDGGKIINKLIEGSFQFNMYKGSFIKITAYGLKFLPIGIYKIIYSERNIEEILDSMEEMSGIEDKARYETRKAFLKLNKMIKDTIKKRKDIDVLFINYNDILTDSIYEIRKILDFLDTSDVDFNLMTKAIDRKLYRKRKA